MGMLYRRKVKGKDGAIRELPTWWVKYYVNGHQIRESTGADKEQEATRFLKPREGGVVMGLTGTFWGTSAPMAVDSHLLTVENPWQGPVAQADRAEAC